MHAKCCLIWFPHSQNRCYHGNQRFLKSISLAIFISHHRHRCKMRWRCNALVGCCHVNYGESGDSHDASRWERQIPVPVSRKDSEVRCSTLRMKEQSHGFPKMCFLFCFSFFLSGEQICYENEFCPPYNWISRKNLESWFHNSVDQLMSIKDFPSIWWKKLKEIKVPIWNHKTFITFTCGTETKNQKYA